MYVHDRVILTNFMANVCVWLAGRCWTSADGMMIVVSIPSGIYAYTVPGRTRHASVRVRGWGWGRRRANRYTHRPGYVIAGIGNTIHAVSSVRAISSSDQSHVCPTVQKHRKKKKKLKIPLRGATFRKTQLFPLFVSETRTFFYEFNYYKLQSVFLHVKYNGALVLVPAPSKY